MTGPPPVPIWQTIDQLCRLALVARRLGCRRALQRARAGLVDSPSAAPTAPLSAGQRDLLARYVDAFERFGLPSHLDPDSH
jgi:hypothetical protein